MSPSQTPFAWRSFAVTTVLTLLVCMALWVFLIPWGVMRVAEYKLTQVPQANHEGKAPLNHISHVNRLATADDRIIVRPNTDTLYSSAWLDLNQQAFLFQHPAMGTRYFSVQLMDAWSNAFAFVGTRTTGQAAQRFAIVGPDWHGTLPADVKKIQAPTQRVWVIVRTMVNGTADVANVTALQAQMTLTPLAATPQN